MPLLPDSTTESRRSLDEIQGHTDCKSLCKRRNKDDADSGLINEEKNSAAVKEKLL